MIERHDNVEAGGSKPGAVAVSKGSGWLQWVRAQVGSLRFGVVQIVVHESRVVQVERTEKVRFKPQTTETI